MRSKKIFLVILALLLIFSWVGNILYFYKMNLDEPLFLKHYIARSLQPAQNLEFELYYIINKNEKLDLVSLELPGCEELYVNLRTYTYNTYTHYIVKKAVVTVERPQIDKYSGSETIRISQLKARFSNGALKTIDIGEIGYNSLPADSNVKQAVLMNNASGTSNNNAGFLMFRAEQPVVVKNIDYAFREMLGDHLRVYSSQMAWNEIEQDRNGETMYKRELEEDSFKEDQLLSKTVFPFQVEAGSYLKIAYRFVFNKPNDSQAYAFFNIGGNILAQTAEGQEINQALWIFYYPNLTEKDIRQIIKERREG